MPTKQKRASRENCRSRNSGIQEITGVLLCDWCTGSLLVWQVWLLAVSRRVCGPAVSFFEICLRLGGQRETVRFEIRFVLEELRADGVFSKVRNSARFYSYGYDEKKTTFL